MLDKLKKFFIGLILAALALSSCTRAAPSQNSSLDTGNAKAKKSWFGASLFKAKTTPTPPGDYVLTINVDGETLDAAKTRTYTLHVPASYSGSDPVGLMVLFPDDGMTANKFLKMTEFLKYTDPNGYVVVLPDALGENPTWNTGLTGASGANDLLFLQTLVAQIQQSFNIDPKKIFASGFGTGGIMAYQIGSTMASDFSAVGVVGGAVGYRAEKGADPVMIQPATGPLSVIFIHGMKDKVIGYGSDKPKEKDGAGYLSFGAAESYWKTSNGCEGSPQVKITRNENVQRHQWENCNGGTTLETISIWAGTHAWYLGGTPKTSKAPDVPATETIFAFFLQNMKK